MRRDRGWDRDRSQDWDRDRDRDWDRDRDRDRDWDRDRDRDRDRDHRDRSRDRDRDRDRERDRDRGRVSRLRPEPVQLRKPTADPGPRHPSGGSHVPPPSRHLWAGNLAPSVSEKMLFEEFRRYGDLESVNHLPGRSYAFVNFSMEQDAVRALRALQGIRFDGSPIKIEFSKGDMEPSEILWIGFPANLNVDETSLRTVFSPFGEIVRIATFPGRSYAFVHFRDAASASRARETLNGKLFNNPRVHISFARSDAALSEVAGNGSARRSPPRRLERDPDFEGYRRDAHLRPLSPRLRTSFDRSHVEPTRRGSGNIHFDEGYGLPEKRQRPVYDEPYPLPDPFERRQLSYSDEPYPLQLPRHESRRGPYPDDSHILPPPVDHRRGPNKDDYYPLHKRMRVSPHAMGETENELPEYPFDELSLGRSTRLSQLNEGFGGVREGPGRGGVLDVNIGKFSSSNAKIPMVKEVWKWEGVIAKGGATVCQARCFPVGKTLDFMLPEILNCSARTNLEMLSRHYYQAAASWVVFFAPGSDSDIASYNDFRHYLTEKQRVAVTKLEEKVSLFLVPPSDFTEKVLKVPGKLSISGLILRFNQQIDADQDPGPAFNQSVSKPGRIIEESSAYKVHNTPDFHNKVGPSSGNFTSGNISSGHTPQHLPLYSVQQQSHGPGALGSAPQSFNPIQQHIHEPGISGFAPPQPNLVQQQLNEAGTSGFAPQAPTNPLQQPNLEQSYKSFQHPPPTKPLQQQIEHGPTSFRPPPPNTLQQHNLEQSPMGFPHPLPPNSSQQQNVEPYISGYQTQPPSNPTWQQTHQPFSAGGYNPFQNSTLSGNFQLRPELTSNYMPTPPLPPGPPPSRAVVPPNISQPVPMSFQFGTNYPSYEQGVQEHIQNQNPTPYPNLKAGSNMNPVMNSMLLPSYTSQAPVQEQIQNQNPNPNSNSNLNSVMNSITMPSYTSQAPLQEQIQNQNPSIYPNPNSNSTVNPMMNSRPLPSYNSQAPSVAPGMWGQSVGQGAPSAPPAVQQQQGGGGSGGTGNENAADPERQKRLQATMQLAAVLLQQMQQQANTGSDKQ